MKSKKLSVSLGLLTVVVTAGIVMQFRTIKSANLDGTIQLTDANLKKSVLQWNEKCDN